MDAESTSSPVTFNPDDLIWAKMKGFPPWPAKVLVPGVDTPVGRIPVQFFGTRENAFMKPSDLCDYLSNKHQHEVPRKHKGFNEGVHEIRVAAGLESPSFRDPLFFGGGELRKSPSPMLAQGHGRSRGSVSGRLLADAFISGYERKRTNSASTVSRSRASSTASALKHLKKEMRRRRLDSESSGGSRRNKMISGLSDKLSNDFFDHLSNLNPLDATDFNLLDEHLGPDDARSTRSKRSRGSSKVFEDYILGNSRTRHRSGSHSEHRGTRSRLISGVSDVFDELFNNGTTDVHAAAEQLMHTLDELPSESSEERQGTPEAPAPLPRPAEFCTDCGCECQLFGNKWRCTSKYCLKWNGIAEPFDLNQPSTSTAMAPQSISLMDHMEDIKPPVMMTRIKKEAPLIHEPLPRPSRSPRRGDREDSTSATTSNGAAKKKGDNKDRMPKFRIKREDDSPPAKREKSARERIREEFDRVERPIAATVKKEKRVQVVSPRGGRSPSPDDSAKSPTRSSDGVVVERAKRATGRPKQYKVEKTPPMNKNGLRNCSFCNGQVRPQMCGGNKHRWRCVDKKCRKWYGWVKSSDEIPRDLGKKGRFNSVLGKKQKKIPTIKEKEQLRSELRSNRSQNGAEPSSISSACEAAAAAAGLDTASLMSDDRTTATGRSSPMRKAIVAAAAVAMQHQQDMPRKKGRPPKQQGLKIKLKTKDRKEAAGSAEEKRTKRKYVKRKDRDGNEIKEEVEDPPKREVSPLSTRETRYRPCAMEKRARWWVSEKRRMDTSPEREFQTGAADAAAAFRILSHAFRAAAVTRADELGTVNGSLDLLMDSLMGSMAPLLSLLAKLPNTRPEPQVLQQLWSASAIHLPMFQ